jgi:hypothetical protein
MLTPLQQGLARACIAVTFLLHSSRRSQSNSSTRTACELGGFHCATVHNLKRARRLGSDCRNGLR